MDEWEKIVIEWEKMQKKMEVAEIKSTFIRGDIAGAKKLMSGLVERKKKEKELEEIEKLIFPEEKKDN